MNFRPLHDRVVVRRIEEDTKTAGGIIIPETAQEKPMQGEIVAVGAGARDDAGKLIAPDVKAGDQVLFGKWSGTEVKIDSQELLIIDELGFVPLSKTGAELLFEVISQRYERGSIIITSNLPFDEWTEIFGAERLTGAILDRLTHHVNILEMNGESFRLKQSRQAIKTTPTI